MIEQPVYPYNHNIPRHDNVDSVLAPNLWTEFIKKGKYQPLLSERTISIRTIEEQMPENHMQQNLLQVIYEHFEKEPIGFEFMACEIYKMSNPDIIIDEITRGAVAETLSAD